MATAQKIDADSQGQAQDLTKKAAAGASWLALSTVLRQVMSFGATALLARKLGPAAYGLMGLASTVMVFVDKFRDLGTAAAIIQRENITEGLVSTLFWTNAGIGAGVSAVLVALSEPLATVFHEPELAAILRLLAVSSIFTSVGIVPNALLNRKMKFKAAGMADVIAAACGYAVSISMAIAGFGVWSLAVASVVSALVLTLVYGATCGWLPKFAFDGQELRSVAGFSANLSGFGFLNYFIRNGDNLIVGRYLGAAALGNYQMAYTFMMYPLQNVTSVLSQVLLPGFSRIQDDNPRFCEAYVRSCSLIAVVTFPLMAGLAVVASSLVYALLGPKWIPAIVLFQILAPVGMVQSVASTTGHIYVAKGRTDWMFRWGIYALIVCLIAFFIGVQYGVTGVAVAYAVAYMSLILYPGFAIPFRLIGLRVRVLVRALVPQGVGTLAMTLVCLGWLASVQAVGLTNPWVLLISTSMLGAVVYTTVMMWWKPPVVKEVLHILGTADSRYAHAAHSLLKRIVRA